MKQGLEQLTTAKSLIESMTVTLTSVLGTNTIYNIYIII